MCPLRQQSYCFISLKDKAISDNPLHMVTFAFLLLMVLQQILWNNKKHFF